MIVIILEFSKYTDFEQNQNLKSTSAQSAAKIRLASHKPIDQPESCIGIFLNPLQ